MVFALLIAAIIWNLGTWWFGLPASSSHTLIGSIVGVGVANALMRGQDGTAGVDWGQVTTSAMRCCCRRYSASFLSASAAAGDEVRRPQAGTLHGADRDAPPPLWIRGAADAHLHAVSFFLTVRTTARRAWASSC